jgi:hypothetical protein
MGIDGFKTVLENIRLLIERRQSNHSGTPLVVPTFVKCAANLGEMEVWYDHWLRLLGCAAILGPSDFAGLIPSISVADMAPPKRRSCQKIVSKMSVLSDGSIISCDQDVLGRQRFAKLGEQSLTGAWAAMATLRKTHQDGYWGNSPLCAACKEWHRP